MLFNSQIFVFIFFPLVLLCYFGLHRMGVHRGALFVLFASSLFFYGYHTPVYLLLLVGSIAFNYLLYRLFKLPSLVAQKAHVYRKLLLIGGITVNLGLLFYFKYYDFFVSNINALFHSDFVLIHVVLPLGISFFTFQQVSFIVDAYHGEMAEYSLLEYCVFVSFFPQLVAGPIVLHEQFIPQLSDPERWRINPERFGIGLRYFVLGLFKKTIVADHFGNIVTFGYTDPISLNTPETVLVILAYTLQIYFDFSGYSDMAIGLGSMLGIDIPMNFNMPYKAVNIGEFWKRWHMTMTNFFTKYLYIPLGGNRKGLVRTCINTMIVFGLSGLWHGAGWTFVAWGMLHGIALVGYRLTRKYIDKLPKLITGIATFVFVNLAWVFFRAEGMGQALAMLRSLVHGGFSRGNMQICWAFVGDGLKLAFGTLQFSENLMNLVVCGITAAAFVVTLLVVFLAPCSHQICTRTPGRKEGIGWGVLAVLAIMTFNRVSTFLYFNF